MSIAVVPYTLRHHAFNLEKVKTIYSTLHELGYDGLENGMGRSAGLSPEEDLELIRSNGLRVCGAYGDIKNPEEVIKAARLYGASVVGMPSIPGEMMRSPDGFHAYAEQINAWAKPFKGTGIRLQYHNHSQEFRNFPELDGKSGMDILIEETDPETVAFELDVFWASAAGCDPAQWIHKLTGRIPVVHYKDMAMNCQAENTGLGEVPRQFAEIGQGNLNWPLITEACRAAGVEWYCVEQDQTKRPVFESLKISIDYMRGTLKIV